jgi:hypothetical protein
VMKCSKSSCTPTPLTTGDWSGSGIAVDSTTVYWLQSTGSTSATIASCPIVGCPAGGPKLLANDSSTLSISGSIAVDSSGIYWTSNSTIKMCPLAGCTGLTPVTIATGQNNALAITLDSRAIYWTNAVQNYGAVMRLAK